MKAQSIGAENGQKFSGWRMVALAFFVNNTALGVAYGGYGVSVLAIAQKFGIGRAVAALPISFIILAVTILAPFFGIIFRRISIRLTMIAGLLLSAIGYLALAWTSDWRMMLAVYLFVVGPGVAASGFLPANVLVSNWFVRSQGKALGLVNMTLFIMLVPMVAVTILETYGLSAVYLFQMAMVLLAIPFAFLLVDRPSDIGERPLGDGDKADEALIEAPSIAASELLTASRFWLLVVCIGILTGSGTTKLAHMVPLLTEQGWPVSEASLLLAVSGGAGIVGSFFFGFLADRAGGALALFLNGVLQASMWSLLLLPLSLPVLMVDAIVMGLCGAGLVAAQGVLFTHLFGVRNFGVVMGMLSAATVPFLVGMGPLIGYLRDASESYHMPIAALAIGTAVAALPFASRILRRPPGAGFTARAKVS